MNVFINCKNYLPFLCIDLLHDLIVYARDTYANLCYITCKITLKQRWPNSVLLQSSSSIGIFFRKWFHPSKPPKFLRRFLEKDRLGIVRKYDYKLWLFLEKEWWEERERRVLGIRRLFAFGEGMREGERERGSLHGSRSTWLSLVMVKFGIDSSRSS